MRTTVPLLVLLATVAPAAAQTPPPARHATPLPPARDGVIRPPDLGGAGRGTDPRMPVLRPRMSGRMPVIRPPAAEKGHGAMIDPR